MSCEDEAKQHRRTRNLIRKLVRGEGVSVRRLKDQLRETELLVEQLDLICKNYGRDLEYERKRADDLWTFVRDLGAMLFENGTTYDTAKILRAVKELKERVR